MWVSYHDVRFLCRWPCCVMMIILMVWWPVEWEGVGYTTVDSFTDEETFFFFRKVSRSICDLQKILDVVQSNKTTTNTKTQPDKHPSELFNSRRLSISCHFFQFASSFCWSKLSWWFKCCGLKNMPPAESQCYPQAYWCKNFHHLSSILAR